MSRPYTYKQLLLALTTTTALYSSLAFASGEVSVIESHLEPAAPYQYEAGGSSYLWGMGQDEFLDGFFYRGHRHSSIDGTDAVVLKRVDIPGVATGTPCGVFAESDGGDLAVSYPLGAGGNCDMSAMLAGRIINRGTLDTFSNAGPAPKNIERVDFLYHYGLLTSLSDAGLDAGGHIVAEKRGNNALKVAAILSLDDSGEPSAYGPLVTINAAGCSDPAICYGVTAVRHSYSFLQSASLAPQTFAVQLSGETENMAAAFISSRDLGLSTAQTYYGFSVFGQDVDASVHDLLNPVSYPRDTADNFILPGDGADLYGGMASKYWDLDGSGGAAGSAVSGDVYLDQNHNNSRDATDPGLAGVPVNLYADSNGNGIFDAGVDALLLRAHSNSNGSFYYPGISDGDYFAELDESSDAIPASLFIPANANPIFFSVVDGRSSGLNFAFAALSGDGTAVNAEDDAITLRQDTSTHIDVLANDSDPVGAGLSVASVTAAGHGEVRIADNQVVYTPHAGYSGSDSFSYTAQDGGGAESTAAVAVKVLRFSDINHNGIDDYEECNCSDIRAVTGVHGSGVGGGNGLWLLLLVSSGFIQRKFSARTGVAS